MLYSNSQALSLLADVGLQTLRFSKSFSASPDDADATLLATLVSVFESKLKSGCCNAFTVDVVVAENKCEFIWAAIHFH